MFPCDKSLVRCVCSAARRGAAAAIARIYVRFVATPSHPPTCPLYCLLSLPSALTPHTPLLVIHVSGGREGALQIRKCTYAPAAVLCALNPAAIPPPPPTPAGYVQIIKRPRAHSPSYSHIHLVCCSSPPPAPHLTQHPLFCLQCGTLALRTRCSFQSPLTRLLYALDSDAAAAAC